MKSMNTKRLLALAFTSCLAAMYSQTASAVAGDTITNTATLSYDVGGANQVPITSPDADFIEDRVINFTVAETAGTIGTTNAAPNSAAGVTFDVLNNSNAILDFSLTVIQDGADNFDVSGVSFFLEEGSNAGYQPLEDTVAVTFLDEVGIGAAVTVHVVGTTPISTSVSNGDVANITLVAQAAVGGVAGQGADITNDDNGNISPGGTASDTADNAGAMDTVFNDAAGTLNSLGAADVVRNGQHSADDSITIASAELTVTKTSAALWDPVNLNSNPKSFPGSYVRYTIDVANAGTATASADLTTLSDALVATLDLDPDFADGTATNNPTTVANNSIRVTVAGSTRTVTSVDCTTGVVDADGCSYTGGAGGTIAVDLSLLLAADVPNSYGAGELKPGETVSITFNVIVQ